MLMISRVVVGMNVKNALVAELVDALDSKSSDFGRVGSIPTQGTTFPQGNYKRAS